MCYKDKFTVNINYDCESIEPLRLVEGGQKDINMLRISTHLSLIATGTTSGSIGLWDYQSSQLLALLDNH